MEKALSPSKSKHKKQKSSTSEPALLKSSSSEPNLPANLSEDASNGNGSIGRSKKGSLKKKRESGIATSIDSNEAILEHLRQLGTKSVKRVKKLLERADESVFTVPLAGLSSSSSDLQATNKGQTLLHVFAAEGFSEALKWVLSSKKDIDVNVKDAEGWTPLHIAAMEKQLDIIDLLLQTERVDLSATSSNLNLPLHYFVRHNFMGSHEQGQAISILSRMHKSKVNLDAANKSGETPLFQACLKGCDQTIRFLLDHGADVNHINSHGETPLHYAVRRNDLKIVGCLTSHTRTLHSIDLNIKGIEGTARDAAAVCKHYTIVAHLDGLVNFRENPLYKLSTKTLSVILSYCSASDLCRVSPICKLMKASTDNELLWKQLVKQDFPDRSIDEPATTWKNEYKKIYLQQKEKEKKEKADVLIREAMKKYEKKQYSHKQVNEVQLAARGWLQRRAFAQLVKKNTQRNKIVLEIYETEKTYVNGLNSIVKGFLMPLRQNASGSKPIINQDQIKNIFSDIEVILGVNSIMLSDIAKRVATWTSSSKIGDVFLQMRNYLKMYTQYVNNYNRSHQTLTECKKNRDFETWLQERGVDISSLLILPIQRIPRYQLLLEQLIKNTWPDHIDYQDLCNALDKIKETAEYVNTKKREAESLSKVLDIQNNLTGKLKDNFQNQPSRRWIKDGAVTEILESSQKVRHLFLFNDLYVLARPRKGLFEIIEMEQLTKVTVTGVHARKFLSDDLCTFQIFVHGYTTKPRQFLCENSEEKQLWIREFEQAIEKAVTNEKQLLERGGSSYEVQSNSASSLSQNDALKQQTGSNLFGGSGESEKGRSLMRMWDVFSLSSSRKSIDPEVAAAASSAIVGSASQDYSPAASLDEVDILKEQINALKELLYKEKTRRAELERLLLSSDNTEEKLWESQVKASIADERIETIVESSPSMNNNNGHAVSASMASIDNDDEDDQIVETLDDEVITVPPPSSVANPELKLKQPAKIFNETKPEVKLEFNYANIPSDQFGELERRLLNSMETMVSSMVQQFRSDLEQHKDIILKEVRNELRKEFIRDEIRHEGIGRPLVSNESEILTGSVPYKVEHFEQLAKAKQRRDSVTIPPPTTVTNGLSNSHKSANGHVVNTLVPQESDVEITVHSKKEERYVDDSSDEEEEEKKNVTTHHRSSSANLFFYDDEIEEQRRKEMAAQRERQREAEKALLLGVIGKKSGTSPRIDQFW